MVDETPGTKVRLAAPEDAEALARLGATTFDETFGHLYRPEDLRAFLEAGRTAEVYSKLIADPEILVMLAEAATGEPVGYVVAGGCKLPLDEPDPGAGEVRELYVLSSHQGHRLGTRLLEAALAWLRERSRSPLYVGVWSENHGAQRLYCRYGFEKVGEYDFPVGTHLDREFILRHRG